MVIVPLCLSLIATHEQHGSALYRLIVFAQPVAALLTAASFFFAVGPVAAALSVAWLIVTGLIALLGLMRLAPHYKRAY